MDSKSEQKIEDADFKITITPDGSKCGYGNVECTECGNSHTFSFDARKLQARVEDLWTELEDARGALAFLVVEARKWPLQIADIDKVLKGSV